jgi:hypothetical protein
MMEAWLLTVVIFNVADISDNKFYNPTVEFPTRQTCQLTADDAMRRYTDDTHYTYAVCYRPWEIK